MRSWSSQRAISCLFKTNPLPTELNHFLQLCSNAKARNQGKQVHQQIIISGLDRHHFMLTKLVQMYAECDDLLSARKLFDELSQPNVFAWTAILGFYSRHGMSAECIRTYFEMKLMGIVPDGYVFPKVLRACAQFSSLNMGILVHKDVIVSGSEFNLQVSNAMIDMYSKCWDVWSARKVFVELFERDLLSWNSMISGYVSNGLFELAVEMFRHMRLDGFEPDIVTCNTVMDAYCHMGLCDEAFKIFEQLNNPNVISWTTLISGYLRREEHVISLKIFRDMINKDGIYPDLNCLSSIIVSCRHLGALPIGQEIHGYGIKVESVVTFYGSAGAALLTMYAKCGKIRDAQNVFQMMDKTDIVTWNAMILGFIDLGLGHLAFECFSKMQRIGIGNDQTTIATVLPVCDLKSGKQIHAFIRKSNNVVVTVWNALIQMYSKCGCIESAYSVFANMVTRDLVSWNTMIGGFGIHGLGGSALELLQEMKQSGFSPNCVTFTSVLSACSHSGLVDEGLKVFYSMIEAFGFNPEMEHFACVVDMLARAGRLEEAVTLVEKMSMKVNKRIWGAILAACREHHNVKIAKLAAERLILLEPEDAGHYVTLSNIYAKEGRWDDAKMVRGEMEVRGLVKLSGQSWIHNGGLTNENFREFQMKKHPSCWRFRCDTLR